MKYLLTTVSVWFACIASVAAQDFQFTNITSLASPSATNAYVGVANGQFGFMCVGVGTGNSNSVTALAFTNPVSATGGYLVDRGGWTNYPVKNEPYFTCVTYGGGQYLASGDSNLCFTFSEAQRTNWQTGTNAQPGVPVDAEGVSYSGVSNRFALVTGSYSASCTTGTNLNWISAGVSNYAILESYKAVTPFNSNSAFALCGVHGDIRISKNAGVSWGTNQIYNFSKPDLLAIGSDNNNTIVAVGRSNLVMVSTQGGAFNTWYSTNLPYVATGANNNGTCFNAVIYTGPQDKRFYIFGTNGQAYYAYATNLLNPTSSTWVPLWPSAS
jgi:hypothetical protein